MSEEQTTATPSVAPLNRPRLPAEQIEWARRTRRHPRLTQPDFLLLHRLVQHLSAVLGTLDGGLDVLDVFCGTRPYEDLLPSNSRCTGFDIDDHFGSADVISHEFLPFEDSSFDLVLCTEAFVFVPDPQHAAQEFARVLRPGGWAILTTQLVWEYSREQLEHRFSGHDLAALFPGEQWERVTVQDVGSYAVSWTTLSGRFLRAAQERTSRRPGVRRISSLLFAALYVGVNALGLCLERFERRLWRPDPYVLPADLMLAARRRSS